MFPYKWSKCPSGEWGEHIYILFFVVGVGGVARMRPYSIEDCGSLWECVCVWEEDVLFGVGMKPVRSGRSTHNRLIYSLYAYSNIGLQGNVVYLVVVQGSRIRRKVVLSSSACPVPPTCFPSAEGK